MRTKILALLMVSMFALGPLFALPTASGTRQDVGAAPVFSFSEYNSYADIRAELERISADYPDITSFSVLGQTWEGRDIMALRLTDKPHEAEPGEPAVLIMGGHHGNELASVEVPLYILSFLADGYAHNATVRGIVDSRDMWFVPLVNPDGREHALNEDPGWRKNRRPVTGDGSTYGVDLNRNYGHRWGELPGTSHEPSSSLYCGPHAFSENETKAIGDLAYAMNFSISISYHTYGQVIYYPWNNEADAISPRGDTLEAVAGKLGAITGYAPMQGIDAYPTTGDSDDWLYASMGCLPFTVELGTRHDMPPEQLGGLYARNLDAALYAIGIAAEPESAHLPEWTFMVYMSADVDQELAGEALTDLNEMEVAGSGPELNIVVLYDGRAAGDGKIYHIQKDPGGRNSAIISPTVDDNGAVIDPATREPDMSDPATLRSFVGWAIQNYPARKYLLGFWGHGDGVLRAFVPDYTSGGGLRLSHLGSALAGFRLDIVGFDTCTMGHLEVAAELAGIADIMIGSQAEEPLAGWDYAASLGKLAQRPWMDPRELATHIVFDYLAGNPEAYITQAALDVRALNDRLLPALGEFVAVSLDFAHRDHGQLWAARNITNTFIARQDAVDLFEFLEKLDRFSLSGPVMARRRRILDMRDDLIVASGTGALYPDARAMAVYFPKLEDPVSAAYSGLAFLGTGWHDYLYATKSPLPRAYLEPLSPDTANNTLGPYSLAAQADRDAPGPFSLFYRPDSGAWNSLIMLQDGRNLTAEVPGHANGTVMDYYFLDMGSNVTEPYEAKWGAEDYLRLTVMATCDIRVSDLVLLNGGNVSAGGTLRFRFNCSNMGPEPATVDVAMTANRTGAGELIGSDSFTLQPGESRTAEFNWTARPGDWTVTAVAVPRAVMDSDLSNQAASLQVPVAGSGIDALRQHAAVIALLAVMWALSMLAALHLIRRARSERRAGAARSLAAAKDFLGTAEGLGADVTAARALLAGAEAALGRNDLPECDKLVSASRESAMNAVGEMGGRP